MEFDARRGNEGSIADGRRSSETAASVTSNPATAAFAKRKQRNTRKDPERCTRYKEVVACRRQQHVRLGEDASHSCPGANPVPGVISGAVLPSIQIAKVYKWTSSQMHS